MLALPDLPRVRPVIDTTALMSRADSHSATFGMKSPTVDVMIIVLHAPLDRLLLDQFDLETDTDLGIELQSDLIAATADALVHPVPAPLDLHIPETVGTAARVPGLEESMKEKPIFPFLGGPLGMFPKFKFLSWRKSIGMFNSNSDSIIVHSY